MDGGAVPPGVDEGPEAGDDDGDDAPGAAPPAPSGFGAGFRFKLWWLPSHQGFAWEWPQVHGRAAAYTTYDLEEAGPRAGAAEPRLRGRMRAVMRSADWAARAEEEAVKGMLCA